MGHSIWQHCLGRLADEISDEQFDTYIKPLQVRIEEGAVSVFAPNIYVEEQVRMSYLARIRDLETPMIEVQELRKPIADFLEGIWQAFGALPMDRLDQTVMSAAPVENAMRRKKPSEITVQAMAEFYGAGGRRPQTVSASGEQRATIPKFHQGRPVSKWVPGQKPSGR